MSTAHFRRFPVLLAALLTFGPAASAWGQPAPAAYCEQAYAVDTNPANGHNPQNVVLIVLDDTSGSELPSLNLPFKWEDQNNPESDPEAMDEAGLRRPDLNRLAARVFAKKSDCLDVEGDPVTLGENEACLGPAGTSTRVVPGDLDRAGLATAVDTTKENFRYDTTSADPVKHVLKGFGGLATLAQSGVVYARHYAPSGRCAPTRASIFTGRSHIDVGVIDNGAALKVQHITIADFLKKRGYRTGLVGKWHMRNGDDLSCWQRGFDETFHYEAPSRRHDKGTSLKCAPLRVDADNAKYFCTLPGTGTCASDIDCAAGEACAPGWQGVGASQLAGKCYSKTPTQCSHALCSDGESGGCACAADSQCQRWGAYLGTETATQRHGCHPDDLENPVCCAPKPDKEGKIAADEYSFAKRTNQPLLDANGQQQYDQSGNPLSILFWKPDTADGGTTHPCYSNESSTFDLTGGGCRYDTRYYRDAAKNFIVRNKNAPFFLYLAIHGLHAPNSAPSRVEAHYKGAPGRPRSPATGERFWGALEEVDAAVGQILQTLTDEGLGNNTLVLLTSDQGRPSSGFGEPTFKGGKGSVSEGGIQVGLHAWGPGLGISQSSTDADALAAGLSSHADLFATIAHASGCRPENTLGQYKVDTCADASRLPCKQPEQCTTGVDCCEANVACVSRLLAGRTLLPKLSTTVRAYGGAGVDPVITDREFSFAQYIGAGKAIIAKKGKYPIGVCGVKVEFDAGIIPGTSVESPIDRVRRAGSTTSCAPGTSGDAACLALTTPCLSNGRFCVPTTGQTDENCEDANPDNCAWEQYPRCRGPKDCAGNEKCMAVKVDCKTCFTASLKLRASGGDNGESDPAIAKDMFDLATNPEELDELNLLPAADAEPPSTLLTTLDGVRDDLRKRVGGWSDCVSEHTNDGEKKDCEDCSEGTTCPDMQ